MVKTVSGAVGVVGVEEAECVSGERGEGGEEDGEKRRGEKSERGEDGVVGDNCHDGEAGGEGEEARLKHDMIVGEDEVCGSRGGLGAAGSGVSSPTRMRERLTCLRIKRAEIYSNASVSCGESAFGFGRGASMGLEMQDFWMAILTQWAMPCGGGP